MKFFKKSLGQNFLIDKNKIKKIINFKQITNKHVIEIGPGKGALTDEILKKNPKTLTVIEKDNKLADFLKIKYSNNNKIKIYNSDILKFDLEKIIENGSVIFGNLPYNISSQILVKILRLKWPPKFEDLIFMFQKELGEKIVCKFPSKKYGRLSILSNYRLIIKETFLISPRCFFPKPKIKSLVIHFKPKDKNEIKIKNIVNLEKITNVLFSNKRKMINKNIKKLISKKSIEKLNGINLRARPENIQPNIYYKITQLYERG